MTSSLNMDTIHEDALVKILDKVDFKDIMRLRQVCHNLKNSIDDTKPDIKLKAVEISVENNYIRLRCANSENESRRRFYRSETNPSDLTYFDDFLKSFNRIMLHQKSKMASFEVEIEFGYQGTDTFISAIGSILESRPHKLKVESLELTLQKDEDMATILQHLESETLRELNIISKLDLERNKENDFKMIEQLDQWKNAKSLNLFLSGTETDLKPFLHFQYTRIRMQMVSVENLIEAKEKFFASPEMRVFLLHAGVEFLHRFTQTMPSIPENNHRQDQLWFFKIEGQDALVSVEIDRLGQIRFDRSGSYDPTDEIISYISL